MAGRGRRYYSGWINAGERLAIYIRDHFRCLACGTDLSGADPSSLTLDHVIPSSQGGSDLPTNLYLCCRSCNSRRGATPIHEFLDEGRMIDLHRRLSTPLNVELARILVVGEAKRVKSQGALVPTLHWVPAGEATWHGRTEEGGDTFVLVRGPLHWLLARHGSACDARPILSAFSSVEEAQSAARIEATTLVE